MRSLALPHALWAGLALAVGVAPGFSQELLDFRFKASHNAYERPFEGPYPWHRLLAVAYRGSVWNVAEEAIAGDLFERLTQSPIHHHGSLRLAMGSQTAVLNSWCLEFDLCWQDVGETLVRHESYTYEQRLVDLLDEYWNVGAGLGTQDRLTMIWFEWKSFSGCHPRSNDAGNPLPTDDQAMADVWGELTSVIPPGVVFTPVDLKLYNGVDPDAAATPGELEWPSPQWLHRQGFRIIVFSQAGSGSPHAFGPPYIANRSSDSDQARVDDGRIYRMYPSGQLPVGGVDDPIEFAEAIMNWSPFAGTEHVWNRGLDLDYNIIAINDLDATYSTYWWIDYPRGFMYAPPMPMHVGGPTLYGDPVVPGVRTRPYGKLRFVEQHLRYTQTISGSGITEPWPVRVRGGTHEIDLQSSTRFAPRVPMRIEAAPGETVRLVPGG